MIYTPYGTTGVDLSAIGFGGMRFIPEHSLEQSAELMHYAYEQGINYFDTAPAYGQSEEIFGIALKEMRKTRAEKPYYISTKTTANTAADVRKDLEQSLKRLNIDCIDFYHVWYVLSLDEWRTRKAGKVMEEFEKLKQEGLIKQIVVSSHMTGDDVGEMLADYPFEGVLLGYSPMNFAYREKGVEAAARMNRGVIAMNPLGGGVIPQNPDLFRFLKTAQEETVVEAALRFLINDPRINVTLVGFSNHGEVDEAIRAVDGYQPIAEEKVADMRTDLSNALNEICTNCRYCDHCPEGLPVPQLMDSYNALIFKNDPQEIIRRIKMHWGATLQEPFWGTCTQCGDCEEACTQKLPIIERIKEIDRLVSKEREQAP